MEKASFKLDNYKFTKASFDLNNVPKDLSIGMYVEGVFYKEQNSYELLMKFMVGEEKRQIEYVRVECTAKFVFKEILKCKEDIPKYFYANSIAIVFPYIRAFISSITVQANIINPIILPTMNLTSLQEDLKQKTTEQ